jgi:hypothetical protein
VRTLVVIVLLASGCHPKVRKAFEARLDTTLATPAPPPEGWQPDATVQLSSELVADALAASLDAARLTARLTVDGHDVRPALELHDLVLDLPSNPCGACTGVVARLGGDVAVDDDLLGVRVDVTTDVELAAAPEGDGFGLRLRPERVVDVDVAWDGVPPRALRRADVDPLGAWVAHRLGDELPPVRLGHVGRPHLPVVAVHLGRARGGPLLELRSAVAGAPAVGAPPRAEVGWTARVGVETVLGLARRALFARGPRKGLWADPRSLALDGVGFRLGLRLWRPAGGWWVDLDVTGTLQVTDGRLALVDRELKEVALSPGAKRLDPVATVHESGAVGALAEALAAITPDAAVSPSGVDARWRIAALEVHDDVVTLRGTATFAPLRPGPAAVSLR